MHAEGKKRSERQLWIQSSSLRSPAPLSGAVRGAGRAAWPETETGPFMVQFHPMTFKSPEMKREHCAPSMRWRLQALQTILLAKFM